MFGYVGNMREMRVQRGMIPAQCTLQTGVFGDHPLQFPIYIRKKMKCHTILPSDPSPSLQSSQTSQVPLSAVIDKGILFKINIEDRLPH
jgi:hypothetical protein